MSKASDFPLADPARTITEGIVADADTTAAARKVVKDWDSRNWWTIYTELHGDGYSPETMAKMPMEAIRQAFATGQLRMLKLSGAAVTETNDAVSFVPQMPPAWSKPMQKGNIAEIIGITEKSLSAGVASGAYRLDELSRQRWRIDLNSLDPAARKKFEA